MVESFTTSSAPDRRAAAQKLLAAAAASRPSGPPPRSTHGPAPLSLGQETLWVTDRIAPGNATYNVPIGLRLRGPLDVDALVASVRGIVSRHRGLQTFISVEGDDYRQVFDVDADDFTIIDLPAGADPVRLLQEEAARGFDLTRPPLWRLLVVRASAEEHLALFNVHHIVFDGWSSGIFVRELAQEYAARIAGCSPRVAAPRLNYDDFSEWQREQLASGRWDDDVKYWKQYLADLPTLDLATDRPLPIEVTFSGSTVDETIDDLGAAAADLAQRLRVTPLAVYSALVAVVLDRYSRGSEVVFAIPAANRGYESLEDVIGYFVNVLPIRCPVEPASTSFESLCRRCHTDIREAAARSQIPFETIVAATRPTRDPSRQPLFQVGIAVEEWGHAPQLPGLDVELLDLHSGGSRYQMSLVVTHGDPAAKVRVEYNTDLFDESTVRSMMRAVGVAAQVARVNPDQLVRRMALLDDEQTRAEVERGIGPHRELRTDTVAEAFAAVAVSHGDHAAVVAEGNTTSYCELDARAVAIAEAVSRRIGDRLPGARVAVLVDRNADLPATVLALLRLGAVYVPIDPSNPELRVRELLRDSEASLLVGHRHLVCAFTDSLQAVVLDEVRLEGDGAELPEASIDAGAPAYVMYTSGSTGVPKGVVVTHSNVVNFIQNTIDLFELTAEDRILGYASAGFDVSVFEMFAALLTGASVHYVATEARLDTDEVQRYIVEQRITVTDLPPSVMSLLDPEDFTELRIVFVGGEPFSNELVDRWAPGRRFFNGYGPTECTVTMIAHECTPGAYSATPPIGLAMDNHVAHVVDASGHVAPQGAVGELVLGGSGLALGYLNRPDETTAAFVDDWIGTSTDGRLYRSGDLVRRNANGDLVYIGRRDGQVKVNGVRIEPGEIEWAMRSHPDIAQAFVHVADTSSGQMLVGYYTAPEDAITEAALREHLKRRLVPAMVPRALMRLNSMPLTSSGKVDRARLPAPDADAAEGSGREFRPGVEQEIWEEIYRPILRDVDLGPEDDFFEAGGASLQAAQVISRVRAWYDVELTLSKFFADSSVAAVALHVERIRLGRLGEQELAERLASMSDEDVSRLLVDEESLS